jgi:cyclase
MLKKRVIPTLLYKNSRLVKGVRFADFRETGLPQSAIRVYSSQDADELLLIDIDANESSVAEFERLVELAAEECAMPLTIGGGIKTTQHISRLLRKGADKVLLNSSVYGDYKLIQKSVEEFGSQAITVGIDFRFLDSKIQILSHRASKVEEVSFLEHATQIQKHGAGELLLTSIDNDGTMTGYDLRVLDMLKNEISIPIVIAGGAGNFKHLADALNHENVSGAACASLFHFGDNNPIRARSYLKNQGILMRNLK